MAAVAAHAYGLFARAGRASTYPGLPALPSIVEMQADLEAWSLDLLRAPAGASALLTSAAPRA
ncbi:MAG: hypothetical protein WDN24_06450 [Sphingomonas sp.]